MAFQCLAWLSLLCCRWLRFLFGALRLKSAPLTRTRWSYDINSDAQSADISVSNTLSSGPGREFGSGNICFGEILIAEVAVLKKVWSTEEGGFDKKGVTFYKPVNLPQGFRSLGFLSLKNGGSSKASILVAKSYGCSTIPALTSPIGYTLVWSYADAKGNLGTPVFFWLPVPPDGYASLGYVVTATADLPSIEDVACVRIDITDSCRATKIAWETDTPSGFKVWDLMPVEVGAHSLGIPVGAFSCGVEFGINDLALFSCLKNASFSLSGMPSLEQLKLLIRKYGSTIYFHPDERYFPSSVSWFFGKGALLYSKGKSSPMPISEDGSNLPQGGEDDDEYWIDLPNNATAGEVKNGKLTTAQVYAHAKPMLGAAFTDIAMWLFYPFNGAATAKFEMVNLKLGKIGEHVSDWEHVTLRVNNLTGELSSVFFSQHSGGMWVDAANLEYIQGSKFAVYSSKSGHASYPHPGLVLQGNSEVGIRNDTAKSEHFLDSSLNFEIISANYLESRDAPEEPPWLQYMWKWGPKVEYDSKQELERAINKAPFFLRGKLRSLVKKLPQEVFGEQGPTGPKEKDSWMGDEKV